MRHHELSTLRVLKKDLPANPELQTSITEIRKILPSYGNKVREILLEKAKQTYNITK